MQLKDFKSWLLLAIFIFGTGLGASVIMNVAIGVSAWDGMTQTIAEITSIKVGTMGMILNILLILMQIMILKKETNWSIFLQIPMSILLGYVVNFVYYDLLGHVQINSYPIKMMVYLLGLIIIAGSVAGIMVVDKTYFPVEGLCMAIAKKTQLDFVKLRQIVDFVAVAIALILYFSFKTTLTVREGTIIGMFLFSPLMGLFIKHLTPILKKEANQ